MSESNLYKFPGYFFEVLVPTLFQATFGHQRLGLEFDTSSGIFTFHLLGKELKSDTAAELVEIAIREIEKAISFKISSSLNQCPYITLPLTCEEDGPPIDICDAFTVEERPYRVEFYTDTLRRGILKLHELRP